MIGLPQALRYHDHRPRGAMPLAVEISDNGTRPHLDPCNFLDDPETSSVTIIDFASVSALPCSYDSLTPYEQRYVYRQALGLATAQ